MWWKIYFWVYTVIMVLGIIVLFAFAPRLTPIDWFVTVFNILLYIGLYEYVLKKKVLEKSWWPIIFWVNVVLFGISSLDWLILNRAIENAFPFLKSGIEVATTDVVMGTIVSLPALYAVYLLTPLSKSPKKKK